MKPPPHLLRLLGTSQLEGPDGLIGGPVGQRHRLALLALLALAPRGALPRDRILGLLWPESSMASARHLLNSTVHAIRRAIAEDVLLTQGRAIALNFSRLRIDVVEFESAVNGKRPKAAIDLYSGPFLDGLVLPDAVEFEHWQDIERDRLERLYHSALEQQAEAVAADFGFAEAARWWRRRLACTPTDGQVASRLMEVLAASGDRAGALEVAATHARLMQSEFGASSDPLVYSLAEQLQRAVDLELKVEPHPQQNQVELVVPRRRPRLAGWRRGAFLIAVGVLFLSIVTFVVIADSTPKLARDRVIIGMFENHTGEAVYEPLRSITVDYLSEALQRSGMQVVPTPSAIRAWRFVQSELDSGRTRDPIRALADETGSAFVVSGGFFRVGDSLRYHAQVTDAAASRLLIRPVQVSASAKIPTEALPGLAERIAGGVASALDFQRRLGINASFAQSPTYPAYVEVAKGRDLFMAGDFRGALVHLHRAAALDSSFLQPLIMAAIAHGNIGQFAKADSLARIVEASRDRLAAHQRLRLDHLHAYIRSDWAVMREVNDQLAQLVPESDAAYVAAFAALRLNRLHESVHRLRNLNPKRGAMRGWPHYWEVLTADLHLLKKHRSELRAARKARLLYPARQDMLDPEIRANAALGNVKRVAELFKAREALSIKSQSSSLLAVYVTAVQELRAHGHVVKANELALQALDAARYPSSGGASGTIDDQRDLGKLLYVIGKWMEARNVFVQLAAQSPANVEYLAYLGTTAARLANPTEALRISAELNSPQQPYLNGLNLLGRARIAALLGNKAEAVRFLRLAVHNGLPFGIALHNDIDFESLHQHSEFREFMQPKR